jgi:hypothetical protein
MYVGSFLRLIMMFFSCISFIYRWCYGIMTSSASQLFFHLSSQLLFIGISASLIFYHNCCPTFFFPHSCISSPFPSFFIGFLILFMFHVCRCSFAMLLFCKFFYASSSMFAILNYILHLLRM